MPNEQQVLEPQSPADGATTKLPIWKRWWFWVIVVVAIVGIVLLLIPNTNGIDVQQERLITDNTLETVVGNNMFPVLAVTVKNTSSVTKKVSFEANFYADGELLGSGYADYVTLAPGDTATLKAQSDHGFVAWAQKEYTYKITQWHVYDQ